MSDTLKELIERYATQYDLSVKEATQRYQEGRINKRDLLEAYLHDEGIYGYTYSLWNIFEALTEEAP